MAGRVLIFGKDACPYTTSAREDYAKKGYAVEYINVQTSPDGLKKMRAYAGEDRVPVIVEKTHEGTKVLVGYGGT